MIRKNKLLILFALIVYFSKFEICLSAETWRYYPATSNDYGYITTKTRFTLEYSGSTEWSSNSWYSEEHCQVQDNTSPTTTVICSTSGYHPFGILDQSMSMNKLDLEKIFVMKSPYCYDWQMALLPVNVSLGGFNLKFELWIRKTDEIEHNSSSSAPSEISKHMTKMFYQIGQRPSVFAFVSHSNDEIELGRQEVEFSANDSAWKVSLVVKTLELLKIKIDESTVGFLNCFIKTTVFEIQNGNFSVAASLNVTESPYENQNGGLELIQNDCTPNVLALIRKDHLLWTEDYFDTLLALVVPGHLLTVSPTGYKAVFTRQGNFVIHTGHETFIVERISSQIISAQGLPTKQLEFSSYPWCHQDNLPHETITDTIVAWTNQSSVYLSLNSTTGFLSVNEPSYFQDQDFRLLDVKVNGICRCVFYLIESSTCPECNGSKVIGYTTQDYETNYWNNVTKLLEEEQHLDNDFKWSFQFLPPNSLSLLIWSSRNVFYKSAKGESTTVVTKKGNISTGDERIIQVTTSNNGEFLVLYEDHSLYYGRIGVDYIIKLNSSFPDDVQIRFVFDLIGYAHVVSLNTSTSSVTRKNFALDNEIFTGLSPDVHCPFIQFSFGNLLSSNVLDKWEQFEIWGYLVYKRSYLNDIQLIWNPTDDLLLTVSERKEFNKDVIMINKTFTFTEKKDVNSTFASLSSFSVTLRPKMNSMTCKRPFHKVFHFHTGCPPTRRAIIRDARSSDKPYSKEQETLSLRLSSGDTFYPAVFITVNGMYMVWKLEKVQYNSLSMLVEDYARIFSLFVTFDENVLIRRIYSTFNILELNAKTDYAVRVNQGSQKDRTIMSFDDSGSFRFSLSFEDRNISFCRPLLEFDVYVTKEHATNYFYVEFACVVLFTMLFIAFLVFHYMMYRTVFLRRHEEDDETKNRLQELQYLAQLQYYRQSSKAVPDPPISEAKNTECEEPKRRAALVTGKSDRRGHRRSSVFERVSKGVFEDLKVHDRSQSLPEPPRELEGLGDASRRNTVAN